MPTSPPSDLFYGGATNAQHDLRGAGSVQGLRFILSSAQPFPPSQPWNPPVPLGPRASGARHRSGAGARSSGCPLHPPRRSCHSAALPPTRGLAGRQHATEVPPSDPRLEPAKPKREKKNNEEESEADAFWTPLPRFGAIWSNSVPSASLFFSVPSAAGCSFVRRACLLSELPSSPLYSRLYLHRLV